MPRQCARTSMASIHQACGRMVARRTGTRGTPVSAGMLASSAALLRVRANNYSPLLPLRPTAAPRRAVHTPVHGLEGGRAPCGQHLHAPGCACCSYRRRGAAPPLAGSICTRPDALAAGGGRDAHAVQRPSPVSPHPPRRIRAPAPSDRAGAHTTADRQGEALDDEPVARGDAPPTFAGIQAIQSASGWRRRWKRETPIRPAR